MEFLTVDTAFIKREGCTVKTLLTKDIVLLLLATLMFFLALNLLMPTFPVYAASLGGSAAVVGFLGGLITFAAVIERPFLAKWSNRIGRRRLLLWSGFFAVTGPLLYLLHDGFIYLTFARIYHALTLAGYITASQTLLVELAPPERRGTVMGWFGVTGGLSMAVAPALGFAIIESFGYVTLFLTGSLLGVGIIVAGWWVTEPSASPAVKPNQTPSSSRQTVRLPMVLAAVTIGCTTAAMGGVNTFLPLYGQSLGIPNVGFYFTALAMFHVAGGMFSGDLSDRIGRFPVLLPSLLLVVAGMAILPAASGPVSLIFSAVLVGAGVASVGAVMLAHVMDHATAEERAPMVAFFNNAFDLGLSAGAMLLGWAAAYSFSLLWLILSGVVLTGFVLTLVQKRLLATELH